MNCLFQVSSELYGDNATRLYGYFNVTIQSGFCFPLSSHFIFGQILSSLWACLVVKDQEDIGLFGLV